MSALKWESPKIPFSVEPRRQNLTSGQVITFKVPFFAPAASNSIEVDDITVRGNVTPGPLPPYAGASKLFLRIKEL